MHPAPALHTAEQGLEGALLRHTQELCSAAQADLVLGRVVGCPPEQTGEGKAALLHVWKDLGEKGDQQES